MSQSSLIKSYTTSEKVKQIVDSLVPDASKIHLKGLIGSSLSMVMQAVFKKTEKPLLLIINEKEAAAKYNESALDLFGEHAFLNEISSDEEYEYEYEDEDETDDVQT